jgi:hypothetical protein
MSDQDQSKETMKQKVVFTVTLLSISHVSSIQFTTFMSGLFFYWYVILLCYRVLLLYKDDIKEASEHQKELQAASHKLLEEVKKD